MNINDITSKSSTKMLFYLKGQKRNSPSLVFKIKYKPYCCRSQSDPELSSGERVPGKERDVLREHIPLVSMSTMI